MNILVPMKINCVEGGTHLTVGHLTSSQSLEPLCESQASGIPTPFSDCLWTIIQLVQHSNPFAYEQSYETFRQPAKTCRQLLCFRQLALSFNECVTIWTIGQNSLFSIFKMAWKKTFVLKWMLRMIWYVSEGYKKSL